MVDRTRLSFDRGMLVRRGSDEAYLARGLAQGAWRWNDFESLRRR